MPKILLIETNLFFSTKIAGELKQLGYEVEKETSFEGARAKASSETAAIIIDLASRGLDAVQIIKNLKNSPETSPIPVIGFCGHADQGLIESAKSAGCNLVTTNGKISSDLSGLLKTVLGQNPNYFHPDLEISPKDR